MGQNFGKTVLLVGVTLLCVLGLSSASSVWAHGDDANGLDGPITVGVPTLPPPTAENPQAAISPGFDIQPVYFLPRGAARNDRMGPMVEATRRIRDQWRGFGWSFDLTPSFVTVNAPGDCNYYSGDRVFERVSPDFQRDLINRCLLYTSPSPRDATLSRMPSSA